ncbi:hypothetical protein L3V59_13580 [Burkholderia aenigmatica]|uniref:hypothetical protein n=1 Tax=Burkholderia aenigmatica TaxID=2015348 RepID=UPI001F3DD6CB|nr:hypothetical protein L3V59_13580 [Burkholderia aenigmatica]
MFVGDRFDVAGCGLEQVECRQFDVERRGRVEFERVRARLASRGVGGGGDAASIGAAGSVAAAVAASTGGATGSAGTDRLAPGSVAAGCGGAMVDAAAGVAATFDTDQLAGDEAGAGGVANAVAPIATGAEAIDGASVAVVVPKDVSEPAGVTVELAIGCAGVAAAVAIGATAPVDGAVMSEAAGGTGRLAAG